MAAPSNIEIARQGKYSLLESLAFLPDAERAEAIQGLPDRLLDELNNDWLATARPNQIQPPGDWTYWLLLAGRGFGKTRVGAETIKAWASVPLQAPIHIVAPTAADVRTVMIEGPSGLLSCYPPAERPAYEPSRRLITWPNGNTALTFSADEPERLRGPQCCAFWADEIAAWRFLEEAWDNLLFGFRLGKPRGVITTTPKPRKIVRDLVADPACVVTRGSTYENRANLAPEFFRTIIGRYEGTRLGRQELLAELLDDTPGALWSRDTIEKSRRSWPVSLTRVVVAVDPSVSSSEGAAECGIVVCGLAPDGHVDVLADLSLRASPAEWGSVVARAFFDWHADVVAAEVNNGGDLVEANIRGLAPNLPVKKLHASRGKMVRAEPVAALYERGMVHHCRPMPELEDQMLTYVPGMDSPDRMDAVVWGVTELLLSQPEPQVTRVQDPMLRRFY